MNFGHALSRLTSLHTTRYILRSRAFRISEFKTKLVSKTQFESRVTEANALNQARASDGLLGILPTYICALAGDWRGKKPSINYRLNDIEKGRIVVNHSKVCTLKLREEFEECGHSFALLIDLLTADLYLTPRAKLALLEYCVAQLKRFEQAEEQLHDYVEDATPS